LHFEGGMEMAWEKPRNTLHTETATNATQ
jgi:hypothetical protein